jgi:hypothetical protein
MSCIQPTALSPCFSKAYFNIIVSSTSRYSKLALLYRFIFKNIVCFHRAYCVLHKQPLSGWLEYYSSWRVVHMIAQFSPTLYDLSHLGSNVFSFMFATHSLCSGYAPTTRIVSCECSLGTLSRFVHVGLFCPPYIVLLHGLHQLRFIPVPLLLRDFHTRVYSLNSACLGRLL